MLSGKVEPFSEGLVRGFLHIPASPAKEGLVLTHGAGGNCRSALLTAAATAFAEDGLMVLRCDLPFRQRRPIGPPFPAQAKEDREGLRLAVEAVRHLVSGSVHLGGHSYGGRQASMLAAELPDLADRLLLLSYPLHPPKKPDQLRTAHFRDLHNSCVFVHGTKDPFGTVAEMNSALALIPARTTLLSLKDAGHDLGQGKLQVGEIMQTFRGSADW